MPKAATIQPPKKWSGLPIFQDASGRYDTQEIRFNFKTKKGFIKGVITAQGEGNVRGKTVKKDAEDNLYIRNAIYTTCNLTTPHFHINASKIKVVHNKQLISGPFNLVINDIPTPLALPFGFFPIPKKNEIGTSGLIFPQYGEEPNGRGFYLRDGGYYFAISQYISMSLRGQIYSNGSWGLGLSSEYLKRYRFGGQLRPFLRPKPDHLARRYSHKTAQRLQHRLVAFAPAPRQLAVFGQCQRQQQQLQPVEHLADVGPVRFQCGQLRRQLQPQVWGSM